ncbi:MAG TPA: hypothetical protein VLT58_16400 [Polyangia bacterium]|nr:hypothetical protein [Polyangia bacterium]
MALTIQSDTDPILFNAPQVIIPALAGDTAHIDQLQAGTVRAQRWTLDVVTTRDLPAAPGTVDIFFDGTDRQLKLIDENGTITPLTIRVGVATQPAPQRTPPEQETAA